MKKLLIIVLLMTPLAYAETQVCLINLDDKNEEVLISEKCMKDDILIIKDYSISSGWYVTFAAKVCIYDTIKYLNNKPKKITCRYSGNNLQLRKNK